jgi:hypothetical protein
MAPEPDIMLFSLSKLNSYPLHPPLQSLAIGKIANIAKIAKSPLLLFFLQVDFVLALPLLTTSSWHLLISHISAQLSQEIDVFLTTFMNHHPPS